MDHAYGESVQLAGLARFTGYGFLADPLAEILAQATSISSAWPLI